MLRAMRILSLFLIALLFIASAQATPLTANDDMDKFLVDKGLLARIGQVRQSVGEKASELVFTAMGFLGVPYRRGGNTAESGFDCSGFVRYVFKQATSLSLPHSAMAISQLGKSVPKDELQPGDLVFFNTLRSTFSHVGIYLGNNRFIHSPSRGGKVRVENMDDVYWAKNFNGAQRIDQAKLNTAE